MIVCENIQLVAPCKGLICSVLATLLIAGCGSSPRAPEQASFAPANPDAALALALRTWAMDANNPQALALAAQAVAAAPKREDAAWLHLRLCDASPRCETPPLEARFRKLAPDNAAVWLSALKRAQSQNDAQAEAHIITAMSRAQRFHLNWNALARQIATALNEAAPARTGDQTATPLTASLSDAVSWLSRVVLPAFTPLNAACGTDRTQDATRHAACVRIAQLLQEGDTYIAEGIGLGLAQRLAQPASTEALNIEHRIDELRYRNATAASIAASQVEREKFTAEMLELMKQLPREQDVTLAILRWAGEPLTP